MLMPKPLFALVLLDLQQAYAPPAKAGQLVASCNRLVTLFARRPIYLIRTEYRRDQVSWPLAMIEDAQASPLKGSPAAEPLAGLQTSHAVELTKLRADAFYKTSLDAKLKANSIEALVIGGISVHGSIQLTAASAYAANYNVVVAPEATEFVPPEPYRDFAAALHAEFRQPYLTLDEIGELLA